MFCLSKAEMCTPSATLPEEGSRLLYLYCSFCHPYYFLWVQNKRV